MSVVSGAKRRSDEEEAYMTQILDKVEHLLDNDELAYLCFRSAANYYRADRTSAFTGHPNFHAYSYFKGD